MALALLAALAGAVVQAATGFGFALVLSPALFAVLDPAEAVTALLVLGAALSVLVLLEGHEVRPRLLAPMLVAALPGLALGALLLSLLSKEALQVGVGVAVVAAALWQLRRRADRVHPRQRGRRPGGRGAAPGLRSRRVLGRRAGLSAPRFGAVFPSCARARSLHGNRKRACRGPISVQYPLRKLKGRAYCRLHMRRPLRLLPGALLIPLVIAAPAAGATHTLTAGSAVARPCHRDISTSKAGRELIRAKAPARGLVSVRLRSGGDWDVAVFGKRGRLVAGSASFRGNELASGFVRRGERLTVQGCRFRGNARRARLSVHFTRIAKRRQAGAFKVVDVMTPKRADKARLQALGLDLTEHGDRNSLEVILHGRADERALQRAGFRYTVRIADLAARTHRNHRRDLRPARATPASGLPSGRDGYRRLPDYDLELKRLAMQYPSLARPITLNHRSLLGRDVNGIEISANAQNTADGKPIFLMMGVHHAREWPSSEHTIEFAYDLLRNYGRDARATQLVDATRTIVVPIVNPDGFNISREAAPLGDFSLFDYEMKRKNCRVSDSAPTRYTRGTCDDNQGGRLRGTDPNRNYGGLWGGSGASVTWFDDTFRGDAPFSEPETQNIRELVSSRQVTNLITNHTYSNLVLRPPGVADFGFPLEEPQYKALGAEMTAHNAYSNDPSFGLYDTTGA